MPDIKVMLWVIILVFVVKMGEYVRQIRLIKEVLSLDGYSPSTKLLHFNNSLVTMVV